MLFVHDPVIRHDFSAIRERAQELTFGKEGIAFDQQIATALAEVSVAGYNVNPTVRPPRNGDGLTGLEDALCRIAHEQHPDPGRESGNARRNAELIASMANLAAQDASLPVTIRRIGGLAAWGLRNGLWPDEAIAKFPPNEKGERVLEFDSTSSRDGHYSRITVRKLTKEEIPDIGNKWCVEPALLIRTPQFGAVSAEFERGQDSVSFETTSIHGLRVTLRAGKAEFTYRNMGAYSDRLRYHESSAQQLNTILNRTEGLTKGLENQVRPLVQTMMANRNTKPNATPVADDPTNRKRKFWII